MWLNNPLRPLEACGTSGMKSALNGGLNLSIRDGWWDEWYDGENGWEIPTADGLVDEGRRDDLEAAALYDLIEKSVAPRFYDRNEQGVPTRWVEMVRHTLIALGPKVLASRMVRDYTEKYYAPAAQSLRKTVEAGAAANRSVRRASWRPTGERAAEAWPKIQITDVDSYGLPDTPLLGSELTLTATVHLADLTTRRGVRAGGAWPRRRQRRAGGPGDRADAAHRYRRRWQRDLLDDGTAAGRGAGGVHGAGVAAPPAAGRRQRARPRHARVTAALKVALDGGPYALAAGPDGALWVTLVHSGAIARVTTGGDVEIYPVAPECRPSIITAGPDGAMWFTRNGDDRIGRISTAGEFERLRARRGQRAVRHHRRTGRCAVVHRDDDRRRSAESPSTVSCPTGMPSAVRRR